MASCCGQQSINAKPSVQIEMKINKEELANEIFNYMKSALTQAGPGGNFNTSQIIEMGRLHNLYFETNVNIHEKRDVKQCILNMRALYHSIRNGGIQKEEVKEAEVTLSEANKLAEEMQTEIKNKET